MMRKWFRSELLLLIAWMLLFVAVWAFYSVRVHARDIDGRWKATEMTNEQRKWFQDQKQPSSGKQCCSDADGEQVEEKIEGNIYWVRSERTKGEWIPVPPENVINDKNLWGQPVAWYRTSSDGKLQVYCFAPGTKI